MSLKEVLMMEKDEDNLYKQVYLFFLKKEANDIVFSYIRRRMNLIFNSDSLLITKSNDSYTITLINKNKKKYWNIYSNKKDINYNILCRKGNLEDVFEFLYKI